MTDHHTPEAIGVDRAMLDRAIGGWRGLVDSGLPATLFVVVYMVTDALPASLIAAVACGVVIAAWRLVRRESLQQVLAGFVGVAISALVARGTGRAEDFFLTGILINVVYGLAYLISILVRWPLMGLVVGYLRGDATGWREDPRQYSAYVTASWIWVVMFGIRLAVQLPMYFAGSVMFLGAAKLVMGWPLFLLAVYLTYRVIQPVLAAVQAREAAEAAALEPEASA